MAEAKSESIEGYLFKLGGQGKKWKQRYIVLLGDKIDYFKKKGASKPHGTIQLSKARGVREMPQCKCKWPSSTTEEYAFGLATSSRTYYFYSTQEEGNVSEWKSKIQAMIEAHGSADEDFAEDHEGKPEGKKSIIARKLTSIGASATKHAIKHAPVDDRVKDGIGAGADMVKDQADADPNASAAERLTLGAKGTAGVVGATVDIQAVEIAAQVVETGADMAAQHFEDNDDDDN